MTKKEEKPEKNKLERDEASKKLPYNPDITSHDKEILNNQSEDEQKGDYFEEREEPLDYTGEDLDVPKMDEEQFNETASKPDDSEKEKQPKKSANSNDDIASQTETVYKGEEAKEYQDPSKQKNSKNKDQSKK